MTESVKKTRSPQFPFISLDRVVTRAKAFETVYRQHSASVPNAAKIWNYSEKSSGAGQTVGALVAFGLMTDEGSLERRKIKLTPLAMTILKDTRPGKQEEAIKEAALKPKAIREMYDLWGARRPPDSECVSTLHLDMNFTEDAARRFLQVYDATIRFAGLGDAPEAEDGESTGEPEHVRSHDLGSPSRSQSLPQRTDSERVVFSLELKPGQAFKVLVTGDVDLQMLKALEAFASFQKTLIVPEASAPAAELGG